MLVRAKTVYDHCLTTSSTSKKATRFQLNKCRPAKAVPGQDWYSWISVSTLDRYNEQQCRNQLWDKLDNRTITKNNKPQDNNDKEFNNNKNNSNCSDETKVTG
jgi:hypothetical protein